MICQHSQKLASYDIQILEVAMVLSLPYLGKIVPNMDMTSLFGRVGRVAGWRPLLGAVSSVVPTLNSAFHPASPPPPFSASLACPFLPVVLYLQFLQPPIIMGANLSKALGT